MFDTYATILVTDHPYSFPFDSYNISLVRKIGSYQVCQHLGPPDERFLVEPEGNVTLGGLMEHTVYRVNVSVYINHLYGSGYRTTIKDFTTRTAGMLGGGTP